MNKLENILSEINDTCYRTKCVQGSPLPVCMMPSRGQIPSLTASSLRLRLGNMLPTSISQIAFGVLEGSLSVVRACSVWKLWRGRGYEYTVFIGTKCNHALINLIAEEA
jgi:hypothetical protein